MAPADEDEHRSAVQTGGTAMAVGLRGSHVQGVPRAPHLETARLAGDESGNVLWLGPNVKDEGGFACPARP